MVLKFRTVINKSHRTDDGISLLCLVSSADLQAFIPQGGTCQNLDRDTRPIFLGLKFGQVLFFWVGKFFSYFSGFHKISAIFWV